MTTALIVFVALGLFCFSILWIAMIVKALQWIHKKSQEKLTGGK